jgi:ABC-type branched-subunit amino acid transport system ATPase component
MAFWIQDIKHELGITVLMVEHDMSLVSGVRPGAGDEPGQVLAHGHAGRGAGDPGVIEAYLGSIDDVSSLLRRARPDEHRPGARRAAAPVLRLLNVESAYGPIKAIRGVSLQVRKGEIATVLGSNGAGKSTILKTISGIIDPRKGSSSSRATTSPPATRRRSCAAVCAHVPEGREVFPLLSVRDNLLMGAYTRSDRDGVARDMERSMPTFPILRERGAGRRPAVGRPAADAGDQRAR